MGERHRFNPLVGKSPWRRKWQTIPVFLPEKSHGQRSLEGCRPGNHKESDTTEHAHIRSRWVKKLSEVRQNWKILEL